MKHPLQNGPALLFGALLGVLAVSASGLSSDAMAPEAMTRGSGGSEPMFGTATRRDCALGLRYSTYHRKCVLWRPFPLS